MSELCKLVTVHAEGVACSIIVPCIADSLLKSVVGSNPPCPERSIKVKCVTLLKSKVLTSSLEIGGV